MIAPVYQHMDICFTSIEQYLDAIKEWDIEAVQLSSGQYNNQHSLINLPKIQIGQRSMSRATLHNGVVLEDCFYFILPEQHCPVNINGEFIDFNQLAIIPPGEDMNSVFPGDFSAVVIAVPATELMKIMSLNSTSLLVKNCSFLRSGKLTTTTTSQIKKQLANTIKETLLNHQAFPQQAMLDIQDSILNSLGELLAPAAIPHKKLHIKQNNRQKIVKRALAYINTKKDFNFSIIDIAEATFCSVRTLEYAFKSVLKISPKQYLIVRRMHAIKSQLESQSNIFIADIVRSFGIVNIGRFSQDYYQLFGKYPSQVPRKY